MVEGNGNLFGAIYALRGVGWHQRQNETKENALNSDSVSLFFTLTKPCAYAKSFFHLFFGVLGVVAQKHAKLNNQSTKKKVCIAKIISMRFNS